jgi:hypothetical protein
MGEGKVMSIENARDPRVTLMREKYFTMRPKPLERWVWQQGLPASAERVYWYHWDLGAQNGSWCSQVPLRVVARDCCLDPATVTRAYQLLKRLSLVRREDPGRDPGNPFQQATSVTEVRVPRDVVVALGREPNRRSGIAPPASLAAEEAPPVTTLPAVATLDRDQSRTVFGKLSAGERTRFAQSSAHRRNSLEFDGDTRLNPTERAHVLATLESLARARPVATQRAEKAVTRGRRLAALDLVKVRNAVRTLERARSETLPVNLMAEIVYAVEEGALAKFPVALAVNIALKKVREGLWSSPNRMPPEWSLRRALPELCTAAGGI